MALTPIQPRQKVIAGKEGGGKAGRNVGAGLGAVIGGVVGSVGGPAAAAQGALQGASLGGSVGGMAGDALRPAEADTVQQDAGVPLTAIDEARRGDQLKEAIRIANNTESLQSYSAPLTEAFAMSRANLAKYQMDKLFKALQIAQTGLGVAVNYDKFMNEPERVERHRRELEAQKKREVDLAAEQQAFTQSQAGMEFLQRQEEHKADLAQREASSKRTAGTAAARLKLDRDEFDREKSDKEAARKQKAMQLAQMDPIMRNVDAVITNKEDRKKAVDEIRSVKELEATDNLLQRAYDTVGETWQIQAALPGTAYKAQVEAAEAQINGIVTAVWPEKMSDADRVNVQGFFPDISDNAKSTEAKRKGLMDFVRRRLGATPTLDLYRIDKSGILPPEREGDGPEGQSKVGANLDRAVEASGLNVGPATGGSAFDRGLEGAKNLVGRADQAARQAADFATGGQGGAPLSRQQIELIKKHGGGKMDNQLIIDTANILNSPEFQNRKKKGSK
jgi:hypothetical protein